MFIPFYPRAAALPDNEQMKLTEGDRVVCQPAVHRCLAVLSWWPSPVWLHRASPVVYTLGGTLASGLHLAFEKCSLLFYLARCLAEQLCGCEVFLIC